MAAPLEDVEALFAAVKQLRDERRKMAKLSDRAGTAGIGPAYRKLVADLDWQAFTVNKLEHRVHAAAVDCGFAELRSPAHYETYSVKLTGFHEYQVVPEKPRNLFIEPSPAGLRPGDTIAIRGERRGQEH